MPDELEKRLERALHAIPPAGEDVTGRARRAALAALPPEAETRRRRRRRLLVPAAACTVAFVFGGVTLAATGGHLPLVGPSPRHHHRTPVVVPARRTGPVLPRGAIAFSATADGRAWLATSAGASLHGRPLSALAVSPGAVNLIEAESRTLRAVHVPAGTTAFILNLDGTATAATWAPAGIRIAYAVHTATGNRLYDAWGNGTHTFLVAAHTNGQAPSWRWDSLVLRVHPRGWHGDGAQPHERRDVGPPPRVRDPPPCRRRLRALWRPARDRRPVGPGASRGHAPPQPRALCVCEHAGGAEDRLAPAARSSSSARARRSPATW